MEEFIRRRDEILNRKLVLPCGGKCDIYKISNINHTQCSVEFLNYRFKSYVDLSNLVDEYLSTILLPLLDEIKNGKFCECNTNQGEYAQGYCEITDDTLNSEEIENWTPCQQYMTKEKELYKKTNEELHNLLYFLTDTTPVRCNRNVFGCGSCKENFWNDIFMNIYENNVEQKVDRINYDTDSNDDCLYFELYPFQ